MTSGEIRIGDILEWLYEVGVERRIGDITFEEFSDFAIELKDMQSKKKETPVVKGKQGTGKRKTGSKYPSSCKNWTEVDERKLIEYKETHKMNWKNIAKAFGRSSDACRIRYNRVKGKY